jgi:hypothetical protein
MQRERRWIERRHQEERKETGRIRKRRDLLRMLGEIGRHGEVESEAERREKGKENVRVFDGEKENDRYTLIEGRRQSWIDRQRRRKKGIEGERLTNRIL